MAAPPAVVGISDHYAWSILVTLALEDQRPVVVDRRRVETLEPGLASAPYHHECLELELGEAQKLVARVTASARERSRAALAALRDELSPGHALTAIALRAAPAFEMPDTLADTLTNQRALYAADGELYRLAFSEAAASLGVSVTTHPRKKAFDEAARVLESDRAQVVAAVGEMGRGLGPPWTRERREAAAAALVALADQGALRLA